MKKIKFSSDVLPHLIAVVIFFLVTVFFFSPFFFEKKSLNQYDIEQGTGLAKSLIDYRAATGEEGLWAESAFSGMPAYLINVHWSNGPVGILEKIYTAFITHPVNKMFACFLSFYILLLAFGVRSSLAIAGALAFGLSSYIIIGFVAGHNARISAIAYMPLTMAGIHLAFTNRKLWGFCCTSLGLALELKSNHLQITYYLLLIVLLYGFIQLTYSVRNKTIPDFARSLLLLIPAAMLAVGSFLGPLWAVEEYTSYSIRGAAVVQSPGKQTADAGLTKQYAFQFNYGFWEPMTLLIPRFYGGASGIDEQSAAYKALVQAAQNGQEKNPNQLARFASSYWGPQTSGTAGPYYGGAIVVFLFVFGALMSDRKYVWWLVPLSILSVMLAIGDSLPSFNYWMFDHFPGYNKFRSASFSLIIVLFCMPLLGFIGLEKLLQAGITKETKRKLLIAFGATGGLALILFIFAGAGSYINNDETALPAWFRNALEEDRAGMLRGDAFRSFAFTAVVLIALYFDLIKKIGATGFHAFMIIMILLDLGVVDRRYFNKNNFKRQARETFAMTPADEAILKDTAYYRVFDLSNQGQDPTADARASYFHHSLGGYHGAKMRRYRDFYDSAISRDIMKLDEDLQNRKIDLARYSILNMLNTKYIMLSADANNVIPNAAALGNAWFVKRADVVTSPTAELKKINEVNPGEVAVIDASSVKVGSFSYDSAARITLIDHKPSLLKYQSQSSVNGLGIFSEVYYPKGWIATIDGKESPILHADFILRALEIPAGKHVIEFAFKPKPYLIGNKITGASSWILLLVVLGTIAWSLKKDDTSGSSVRSH